MSLRRLLEIERRLLSDPDDLGLRFAEKLWIGAGSPVESNELCHAIERILLTCEREGVHYPAILLRRKKELERGTWKPRPAPAARPVFALASPIIAAQPAVWAIPANAATPETLAPPAPVAAAPAPASTADAVPVVAAASAESENNPENNLERGAPCTLCGGSGIVKDADGQTGRACECFLQRWVKRPA